MQWTHTRREFLAGAVGANVPVLLAPEWLRAQANTEDPRVADILSGTIGIDMHNHVTPGGSEGGVFGDWCRGLIPIHLEFGPNF